MDMANLIAWVLATGWMLWSMHNTARLERRIWELEAWRDNRPGAAV